MPRPAQREDEKAREQKRGGEEAWRRVKYALPNTLSRFQVFPSSRFLFTGRRHIWKPNFKNSKHI